MPAPVRVSFSKQEAVAELAPVIAAMRVRKFRLEDIVSVMNSDGQNFTASSIKTYLARIDAGSGNAKDKPVAAQKKRVAVDSQVASSVQVPVQVPVQSGGARLRAPVPEDGTI